MIIKVHAEVSPLLFQTWQLASWDRSVPPPTTGVPEKKKQLSIRHRLVDRPCLFSRSQHLHHDLFLSPRWLRLQLSPPRARARFVAFLVAPQVGLFLASLRSGRNQEYRRPSPMYLAPWNGALPYCSPFSFLFTFGLILSQKLSVTCALLGLFVPPPPLRCLWSPFCPARCSCHCCCCCSWLSSATIFHQNTKPQWSIQAQARSTAAPPSSSHPALTWPFFFCLTPSPLPPSLSHFLPLSLSLFFLLPAKCSGLFRREGSAQLEHWKSNWFLTLLARFSFFFLIKFLDSCSRTFHLFIIQAEISHKTVHIIVNEPIISPKWNRWYYCLWSLTHIPKEEVNV